MIIMHTQQHLPFGSIVLCITNTTCLIWRAGTHTRTHARTYAQVVAPKRFGQADEFAHLALALIDNGYMNGEVIRMDGGLRFANL